MLISAHFSYCSKHQSEPIFVNSCSNCTYNIYGVTAAEVGNPANKPGDVKSLKVRFPDYAIRLLSIKPGVKGFAGFAKIFGD